MKNYYKYLFLCIITVFSFYYVNKIIELSEKNNTLLVSINKYADENNYKCREGSISEEGIVLGLSGLIVNMDKSYNNMKGLGFRKELIEYDEDKCILNKDNNLDKYIIKGNDYENNISLVVDVDNGKYFNKMIKLGENKNVEINVLMNYNMLKNNIDVIENHSNILFKGNNDKELNNFISILHNEFFCVKTNDFDVIDICKEKRLNSIKIIDYIDSNLLSNTKKILDKGKIIFIKETKLNLDELSSTINYIESRGYNIVNINKLLS
ncbi:MAG: hypothetical protein IJK67_04315 [Bacilli bacterium]|nr:hypothetical protein [Bacilli bacterium]